MPITLAIPFGVRCPGYLTPWANQMTYHAAHTPRLGMSPDFNTQKWVTTVTDVMMLNYAGGLDLARDGTQCNTQGVWPCNLPTRFAHEYYKFEMSKIVRNDAPFRHRLSAQRPIFNLIGNIVTR